MLIILQDRLDCRLLGVVEKGSFVHYNSSNWILIEELGDAMALALIQKPLIVLRLRWKRKADQNLSEWKVILGIHIHADKPLRRPRLSPSDGDPSTPRDTSPFNVPTRTLPKRSAYVIFPPFLTACFKPTKSSDDSDEYEITPRPRCKQNAKSRYESHLLLEWPNLIPIL